MNSEANLDEVWANATSVGGGRVTFTEGTVADDTAGNGMDANGATANGNGATANGNGATANGNGVAGNGNGMTEEDMPDGNGVYTGTVTVTGAMDAMQTISIWGKRFLR